jgi:AmmeMemoRadiSam system protein B
VKVRPGKSRRKTLPKERDYVRPPAVAGLFYPAEKGELEKTCLRFLEKAKAEIKISPPQGIFGIISPHAGYPYSGYTAAHGYSMLKKGQFDTVIVISPSHREYFDGISVFSGKAYSTPLGEIEVDGALRDSFVETAGEVVIESRAGHKSEHALEVQLPFLQLTLGTFTLLPIVIGDQNRRYCKTLGSVIADIISGRKVLVVASSDLSHYYDYDTANEIDSVTMTDISGLDPDKFLDDLEGRRCEACGGGPISALLYAGKKLGKTRADILYHCNSGDTTGDKSGVVGYLSAIIS